MDKANGQINLLVEEFIEQSSVTLYLPEELQCIIDAEDLTSQLLRLKGNKSRATFVLIVPPDKSIALILTEERIILYDSHKHQQHGALIAYSNFEHINIFSIYIEKMVDKYFKSCLPKSNLIYLEMMY